jgi:hypothetical protein
MCVFDENHQNKLTDMSIESGHNPIFNILTAYAQEDPTLGYTQGMNFVAGLVFLAVQDEYIAFAIFRKVLMAKENGGKDWRRFYITGMPKLMEMSKLVRTLIDENIEEHF